MPARLFAALLVAAAPTFVHPSGADPSGERLQGAVAELERDRASARAIVPLAELHALEEAAPDLAALAKVYARVADDRASHPEVRALARQRLADVERSRGNLQRAAAHVRRLGFVTGWTAIGPFDGEGRSGFDATFPPEDGIDLSGRYAGKAREVGWRALPPTAVVDGFVHLGAVLRPAREVVAYAVATVDAPRDGRATIHLGASGAAKVWVNGAVAIAEPEYHRARIDQRAAEVTLRRGQNRILVKLCHESGRMGFFLRLTDGSAPEPVVAALEKRVLSVRGPGAAARRAEAEARHDLAVALDERGIGEGGAHRAVAEARRAAELAPRALEHRLLLARLEDDRSRRREAIDAALAIAPGAPRALLLLAREELALERPHEAVRILDRALAAAPDFVAAHVLRIDARERAGQEARAARDAAALAGRFPTAPDAVAAGVRGARRLGRLEEATLLLRKSIALRFDDATARSSLAQLLLDRGDLAGAVALLRESLRLDPADPSGWARLGDVLAANGRAEDADGAWAEAIRLAPEEADTYERRGRARVAAGDAEHATEDLQRALELRPQNPQLKELVRSLQPARERFERPYLLDAAALARAAKPPRAEDDAVVLGELKVTRVFPSGLSATFQQTVVKAVTARGVDATRRQTISYAPDRQELKVERARVLKADGTVVEAYDESERSTSEPWYRLYYDTRARTLTFPALAPGDVLEFAWRVEDVAGENLLSDYFGDLTYVEDGTRKERFEYVLLVPSARPIHHEAGEGFEHRERPLDGGVVEHRFTARDVPRLRFEPMMPGWSETSRYVHVSTYASWDEVARFYWGLVKEQLRPNDDVRATAERIAGDVLKDRGGVRLATVPPALPLSSSKGQGERMGPSRWDRETELAIVKAVYEFVVSQTRYVGLEFGIHGFKPYRVDQILQRRFGDCKDKASLMHALLAAVGIDSRVVLLRMRKLGRMPEAPASLAMFNHAILYVPRFDLWLDGTASFSGSRDLPGEDRGATVLVVNPDGAPRFGYVPEAKPEENRTESIFDVALAADGRATLRGTSRIRGVQAPGYRRAYQAEGERRATLEQAFNRTFPGLEVKSLSISDLARIEDDVAMQFELEVARYAQPDGEGLRFTPFGSAAGYTEAYAAASSRRHDLVLGDPSETRFTYRYAVPPGWRVVDVPDPAEVETPFGAFAVRYRKDGGGLVAEGHVTFRTGRVAAKDYPAFRRFTADVDRAFGRKVRIAPTHAEAGR
jgi:cellulose synthase operon protein C